jgi:TRAP-type mannitol/chloroaromatic compound transport system permease small subunit
LRRYLFAVDHLSAWVGKGFATLVVILTAIVCYDVITRKLFNARNQWASDMEYILYGIFFMMAGAYALSRNQMVRGDMFYRLWSVRTQAKVDLALYVLFFLPGILALVWSGWIFADFARVIGERSTTTPNGPLIWPFKYFIPISAGFLLLQGIVEMLRCAIAIRTGEWPERLSDVEETETRLAREAQL